MELIDNKYRILRTLGKGGGGTVYVCFDESMNREVAVKILNDDITSATNSKRFLAEAQALSLCKHPNVVSILNFGTTPDGHPYYVMEYIDGHSLSAEIQSNGPLPPDRFRSIFTDILNALSVAHSNGIVHRDIKPSNIMLSTTDGAAEKAILIDFGITKRLESAQKLTATNSLLGTPYYMSPEQCKSGDIDARSDIYSLGCTMFEAATGQPPFVGDSLQVMMAHLNEPVTSIPKELAPVLERCLAKSPSSRFNDASDMLSAFQQLSTISKFSASTHRSSAHSAPPAVLRLAVIALIPIAAIALFTYFETQKHVEQVEFEEKQAVGRAPKLPAVVRFEQAVKHKDVATIDELADEYFRSAPFSGTKIDNLCNAIRVEYEHERFAASASIAERILTELQKNHYDKNPRILLPTTFLYTMRKNENKLTPADLPAVQTGLDVAKETKQLSAARDLLRCKAAILHGQNKLAEADAAYKDACDAAWRARLDDEQDNVVAPFQEYLAFLCSQKAPSTEVVALIKKGHMLIRDRLQRGPKWVPEEVQKLWYMSLANPDIGGKDKTFAADVGNFLSEVVRKAPSTKDNLSYRLQLLSESAMLAHLSGNDQVAKQRFESARALGAGVKDPHVQTCVDHTVHLMMDAHLLSNQEAVASLKEEYERYFPTRKSRIEFISTATHYANALAAGGRLDEAAAVFLEGAEASHALAMSNKDAVAASWFFQAEIANLCGASQILRASGKKEEAVKLLEKAEREVSNIRGKQRDDSLKILASEKKFLPIGTPSNSEQ